MKPASISHVPEPSSDASGLTENISHYGGVLIFVGMLDRYYLIPPTLYAVMMYALWGFPGLTWGFFISTIVLYHCTFFINSLTHMFGSVRYRSHDGSRNSCVLAILCCGEGWHNNHHFYQSAVRQGWFWWEVDLSYYILHPDHAVLDRGCVVSKGTP